MQKLTQNTIDKLESKGLVLFGLNMKDSNLVIVAKPITTKGNCVEGRVEKPFVEYEEVDGQFQPKKEQFETDTSVLGILNETEFFSVRVWNWIPGPGPGDFEIKVATEEDAYNLTINYFFEENAYFKAYHDYYLNS